MIPQWAKRFIVDNDIHVFYLDGFKIAREEASNADLQFRMHSADGTVKRLRNVVNVVRDNAGQPAKIRGFIIDITPAEGENDGA